MSGKTPLVSVVVVCFNGLDITRQCLTSVFRQDYHPKEVIVVDNGSQERIRDMVVTEFPQAQLICLDENLGFAGGHNKGIEAAQGKYVAIINNDAVASPQWLSSMVDAAERDEQIGAVASIITDGNRPAVLDSCGVGVALDGMSRQALRGKPPPVLDRPQEILLPSGCACLLRMDALQIVGLFDESFFAYCEDTDLGLRLRWAGFKAVVTPDANVTHYYSMTTGKFSLKKVFWVERNHFWVTIKNFPVMLLLLVPFVTLWRYLVQTYAVLSHSGDLYGFTHETGLSQIIMTIIKAYIAALVGVPLMFRKRIAFLPKRTLNSFQMLKLIWVFKLSIVEIVIGAKHAGK